MEAASRHVLDECGTGRKVAPAGSRRSREALPLRRDRPILPTILRPACFAVWPPHGPRTYAIRCTDCRTCPVRKEPPIRSRFLLDDPRWFTCAPAQACYGLSLFPVWTSGRRRRVWTSQSEWPRYSARGWLPTWRSLYWAPCRALQSPPLPSLRRRPEPVRCASFRAGFRVLRKRPRD